MNNHEEPATPSTLNPAEIDLVARAGGRPEVTSLVKADVLEYVERPSRSCQVDAVLMLPVDTLNHLATRATDPEHRNGSEYRGRFGRKTGAWSTSLSLFGGMVM